MSYNPPQPPAPDVAASGETLELVRQTIDDSMLTHTGRSIGDRASGLVARDALVVLENTVAAAVQAEKRRVLERIRQGLSPYLAKRYYVPNRKVQEHLQAVLEELRGEFAALLDSEQHKLGGK